VAALPGVETFAARMMKKKMEELDLLGPREMIRMLDEAGAELYGSQLAMDLMTLKREDLLPEVKDVITAGDFFELAEGAQIIFT
jgi:peroxiredoxin family protein